MVDLSYINFGKLERLNEYVARHTQFENFEDLVNIKNNFRPTFYVEYSAPNLVTMELRELADYYDKHMKRTKDPRRIYHA